MTRMNHNRCLAFLAAGMIVLAFLGCRGDGSAVVSGGTADGQAAGLSARRPLADFDGRIVFQSDLGGNNDIYLLTRAGLRRLTDDPASDEFPR